MGQRPPEPWNAQREGYLKTDFLPPGGLSFGGLLTAAFSLFFGNFAMVTRIVLVVWLPLDGIKNFLIHASGAQEDLGLTFRVDSILNTLAGTWVAPALIYALWVSMRERREPSIREAYGWGSRFWRATLNNGILAGLAVVGGLLLLVIPGFVFLTWFLLVNAVVAVEGDRRNKVLSRSRNLTEGHRPMLFGLWLTTVVLGFLTVVLLSIPLTFVDHWAVATLSDSIANLLVGFQTVLFLLAYLHLAKLKGDLPDEQEMSLGPSAGRLSGQPEGTGKTSS